jgi:hypothetical protein
MRLHGHIVLTWWHANVLPFRKLPCHLEKEKKSKSKCPTPLIKSGLGGFTHLSWVILAKNSDSSMLAHMEGHEGNLPVGT